MPPSLHAFVTELTKVARIFGAEDGTADIDGMPFDKRLERHRAYLAAKAAEEPTSRAKAMGISGVIGGLLGGGMGAQVGAILSNPLKSGSFGRGLRNGGIIGGLGGLTVGALLGNMAANTDRRRIADAGQTLADGGEEESLLNEIEERHYVRQSQEEADRAKLYSIRSGGGYGRYGYDDDYGHGKGLGKKASAANLKAKLVELLAQHPTKAMALAGAGTGALAGGEGNRLEGALLGGTMGALAGRAGRAGAERLRRPLDSVGDPLPNYLLRPDELSALKQMKRRLVGGGVAAGGAAGGLIARATGGEKTAASLKSKVVDLITNNLGKSTALVGAGVGAATSDEGHRLRGALQGGALGAIGGTAAGIGGNVRLTASAKKSVAKAMERLEAKKKMALDRVTGYNHPPSAGDLAAAARAFGNNAEVIQDRLQGMANTKIRQGIAGLGVGGATLGGRLGSSED